LARDVAVTAADTGGAYIPGVYSPETAEPASPVPIWSELLFGGLLFWAAAVTEARHNRAAATPSVLNVLRIM
jgi:hypothetical protein